MDEKNENLLIQTLENSGQMTTSSVMQFCEGN